MEDLIERQTILDSKISNLITTTNISNADDKKRSVNYLKWLAQKTELIQQEKEFCISANLDNQIKRGNVVWVEFGFNLGREFGGKHPALIWRRTGDSIFAIPLSSQRPLSIKSHHVKIEKVHGFADMERWCNVLKIQNVSIMRIDTSATIGNVKGHILDNLREALKNNTPY